MKANHRITIDFSDMPELYERIKTTAENQARSLAAQLKFECLPFLAKPKPAKRPGVKLKQSLSRQD